MNNTQIIIYQSEDGKTKIETRLENETLWLNQSQISEVFQVDRSGITKHINNIFKDEELDEKSNVQSLHIGGSDKPVKFYNLELIIAVGYRVRSKQGIQFRNWATSILKEYMVKGFTMNDDLLKGAGGGNYFDELLARIRDIRSSEKVFYRKILDIYATSVDYDSKNDLSIEFFKTIQNKIHYASHGNTAAELVYQRVDSHKLNLGMSSFSGTKPTKKEVSIAKNYLSEDEIDTLNRIVSMYLEYAELQAKMKKQMYMKNWIKKLDDFLSISDFEILKTKGMISHKSALDKANAEYELYKQSTQNELSKVEKDFLKQLEINTKKIDIL